MSVEVNPNYPSDLDASTPTATDPKQEGDDNIRNVKRVLKTTFPNVTGAITATHTQINSLAASGGLFSVGTSTTSLTIGAGTQSFTTQAGIGFAVGQNIKITSNADVTAYMTGTCTAYNSTTGAMSVNVTVTGGSGTAASWSVIVNIPSAAGMDRKLITGTDTLLVADLGKVVKCSGTTDYTVTAAAAATLGANWFVSLSNEGSGIVTISAASIDGATTKLVQPGDALFIQCSGTDIVTQRLEGEGAFGAVSSGTVLNAATTDQFIAACGLSATQGFVLYRNSSNFPVVALVDNTGTVLATSSTLNGTTLNSSYFPDIKAISANSAIAVWADSASNIKACALSVSGTTFTLGSVVTLLTTGALSGPGDVSVAVNSSTLATVGWTTTTGTQARSVSMAALVLTAGTSTYTLDGLTSLSNLRIAPISATQSLLVYANSSTATFGFVITNTAGVLTFPASHAQLSNQGSTGSTGAADVIATPTSLMALVAAGSAAGSGFPGLAYTVTASGTGSAALTQTSRQQPVVCGDYSGNGNRLAQVSPLTFVRALTGQPGPCLSLETLYLKGAAVRSGRSSVMVARNTNAYGVAVIGTCVLLAYADVGNSSFPTIKTVALGTVA